MAKIKIHWTSSELSRLVIKTILAVAIVSAEIYADQTKKFLFLLESVKRSYGLRYNQNCVLILVIIFAKDKFKMGQQKMLKTKTL